MMQMEGVMDAGVGPWTTRALLGLQGMPASRLRAVLQRTREMMPCARSSAAKCSALSGRVVGNLFFEESTRTRTSFALAAQRCGAEVVDLSGQISSINKGETLVDTARNVEAMGVDAIVVRSRASGSARMIAAAVDCAVVNAGDGKHEHPTQGLLDIYTLAEAHGRLDDFDLSGLRVAIVGDLGSSRVARSDIAGMTTLGAQVVCVGPPALAPQGMKTLGCEVSHALDEVIESVDAVVMLRIQFERHGDGLSQAMMAHTGAVGGAPVAKPGTPITSVREYRALYALTEERGRRMKPGAVVMHPGPINRGLELDAALADGPRSVVLDQVSNGVAVRMAALSLCVEAM